MKKTFVALLLCLLSGVAQSAQVVLDNIGRLTGARGVQIGSTIYDVDFVYPATCAEVYSGCNEDSDFFFKTYDEAYDAVHALYDQVMYDRPEGNFFSDQSRHLHCNYNVCGYDIPYMMENELQHRGLMATITYRESSPRYFNSNGFLDGPNSTYRPKTLWTAVSTVVPIPAAVWLFGSALAALGWLRRKQVTTV